MTKRIFIALAEIGEEERAAVLEALDSDWIGPVGPQIEAFEREFEAAVNASYAVALSSGTAALHLALVILGVQRGDDVLLPSATFVATANAVCYVNANPVFIDSDSSSWNIDPDLLADEIETRVARGKPPKAVMAVDLYGQCADYKPILAACRRHGIPLVQDAAEALGATYRGARAGTQGDIAIFSFNGNKIITSSTGGMLVTANRDFSNQARFLATQARDPAIHHEHSQVGFNYRMSNILAALGRAQLRKLDARVARRWAINSLYREVLADTPG
ncbi:MAG TPA: aminotransferase class I/II-fold pyridoxal phosphate-dependent enzyme, partial [Acidimicrobiales bacterium]